MFSFRLILSPRSVSKLRSMKGINDIGNESFFDSNAYLSRTELFKSNEKDYYTDVFRDLKYKDKN